MRGCFTASVAPFPSSAWNNPHGWPKFEIKLVDNDADRVADEGETGAVDNGDLAFPSLASSWLRGAGLKEGEDGSRKGDVVDAGGRGIRRGSAIKDSKLSPDVADDGECSSMMRLRKRLNVT